MTRNDLSRKHVTLDAMIVGELLMMLACQSRSQDDSCLSGSKATVIRIFHLQIANVTVFQERATGVLMLNKEQKVKLYKQQDI